MRETPLKGRKARWPTSGSDAPAKRVSASLRVEHPAGDAQVSRVDIAHAKGGEAQAIAMIVTRLDYRLARLRRLPAFIPFVESMEKLVAAKGLDDVSYMSDWEVRGRLAEAELEALYLAAKKLPKEALHLRASDAGGSGFRKNPPPEWAHAEAMWKDWRIGKLNVGGKNRRADFLRLMGDIFPGVNQKRMEGWMKKWGEAEKEGAR